MRLSFFDESGRFGETDYVSMATCDAQWYVWQQFNPRWNAALGKSGAPYLHMREYAHRTGPFKGWTEERRRTLMADCLDAIKGLEIVMFTAVVRSSDFRALTAREQDALRDPYLICFQECLFGTSLVGYLNFPGDKVDVVYSQQDEFRKWFRKIFKHVKETTRDGHNLGHLGFRSMVDCPGLQLADLIAYEMSHHYHLRDTKPHLPVRFPLHVLYEHQTQFRAQGFRFVPLWQLRAKGRKTWRAVNAALWAATDVTEPLLLEMFPSFVDGPRFVRRLVSLKAQRAEAKLRGSFYDYSLPWPIERKNPAQG
jgi:hypothetical protein